MIVTILFSLSFNFRGKNLRTVLYKFPMLEINLIKFTNDINLLSKVK